MSNNLLSPSFRQTGWPLNPPGGCRSVEPCALHSPCAPSVRDSHARGSSRCRHRPSIEPLPKYVPRPSRVGAHSTHLAGTDDQPGGSPRGVPCALLQPHGSSWQRTSSQWCPNSIHRDRLLVVDVLHVRFLVLLFQVRAEHPDEVVGAGVVAVRGDGNADQ